MKKNKNSEKSNAGKGPVNNSAKARRVIPGPFGSEWQLDKDGNQVCFLSFERLGQIVPAEAIKNIQARLGQTDQNDTERNADVAGDINKKGKK